MHAAIRLHKLLKYAPTNLLLSRLRSRRGLKWGIPFMLLGATYMLSAALLATWLQHGGPGWLNLVVALGIWNGLKFLVFGPVSLLRLWIVRIRESQLGRQSASIEPTASRSSHRARDGFLP
jgi:hypothetical protein